MIGPPQPPSRARRRAARAPRACEAFLLRSRTQLLAIEEEWELLAARCRPSSVFQLPGWVIGWWEAFGEEGDLSVVALRQQGSLCAVLPLAAPAGRSDLTFVGCPLNDRNGMLAAPADLGWAWAEALGVLRKTTCWSSLAFGEAPPADREACLGADLSARALPPEPSPLIELPSAWREYAARLSRSSLRTWSWQLRALERGLAVDFAFESGEGVTSKALLDFHGRRLAQWNDAGRIELLTAFERSDRFGRFLERAGGALARGGHLGLAHLMVDGKPAASDLYLFWEDVALLYMRTYDRALSRFSPGSLCMLLAIRHLIERGFATCDLGRGDETYKSRFGAVPRGLGGIAVAWA